MAAETLKALDNIEFLLGGRTRITRILLGGEGLIPASGLPALGRKEGISALLVPGDMELLPGFRKLKFLLQMNMFRTGISECAHAFLPVTGFMENSGHFINLEGRIKQVRRALDPPGNCRSIPAILEELAKRMGTTVSLPGNPAAIWKEIGKGLAESLKPEGKYPQSYQSLAPLPGNGQPEKYITGYRYRGNPLESFIPDLKALQEQIKQRPRYG
jgi:anaerobic selenocysteine-containing dehydrogenase